MTLKTLAARVVLGAVSLPIFVAQAAVIGISAGIKTIARKLKHI